MRHNIAPEFSEKIKKCEKIYNNVLSPIKGDKTTKKYQITKS